MTDMKKWLHIAVFLLIAQWAGAQKMLSGIVRDAKGTAIPGVNINASNKKSTVTDLDGTFQIEVKDDKTMLTFSMMGYQPKTLKVGNQSRIEVQLSEGKNELDEVVVVGYGTQKKKDVTGAVSSVNMKEMMTVPTTNVNEMLRGRVAGVSVTVNSSRPGGSSDILIRGQRSLSGSNSPLYVVDGSPVTDINDLNANDIKSVEVLKDASSQAIYGARASAGVILITTKRGSTGKLQIDFSASTSTQRLKQNFELMNGQDWVRKLLAENGVFTPIDQTPQSVINTVIGDNMLISNYNAGKTANWLDELIRPSTLQTYNLSIRGGNENTKIGLSMNYFNQVGMILNSGYERISARLNVDHKLTNRIKIGSNVSYTHAITNQEDGKNNSTTSNDMLQKAITLSPYSLPYDDQGNVNRYVTSDLKYNPIWNSLNYFNEIKAQRFLMNFFTDIDLVKGLKYRFNSKYDTRHETQKSYQTRLHQYGVATNGWGEINKTDDWEWLAENILTYDKTLNANHRFDVTLVQSANKMQTDSYTQNATQFLSDVNGVDGISNASYFYKPKYNITPRQLLSYMGRLRYTLMERYLFTVSVRRDGSSVFGPENKWGTFPSASVAWRINEESLVKNNLPQLTNLKLRMSYGVVGNQGISPFQSMALANEYDYLFGGDGTYTIGLIGDNSMPNPYLKWEQTASKNIGIDFGFFDNRISGSFEYYDTHTTDLLVYKKLPAASGYSNQLTNIGEVQNEGIELQLSADLIKTAKFYWGVNLTYSRNRNAILQIDGQRDTNGNLLDQPNNNWFIGHNINAYYEYEFAGIFNNIEEVRNAPQGKDPATGAPLSDAQLLAKVGSIRVNDQNGDGVITTADKKIFDAAPKWIGSLSTTFKYKGFDLFLDFYTVQGVIKRNSYLYDYNSGGSNYGSLNGIKVNYWTPEGQGQEAPLPTLSTGDTYIKSLGIQDASYIRLRTVSLGYTFPKNKWLDAMAISRLNFYVSLTNYWTWTQYKSFGPETSPSSYPEPKIVNMGMNLSF